MSFKNNFSINLLLANKNVLFWDNKKNLQFEVIVPTVFDFYTNENLMILISLLDKDISEIVGKDFISQIDTHYKFFRTVFNFKEKNSDYSEISNSILNGMKIFLPDFKWKDEKFFIQENIEMTEKLFNEIIDIVFKSIGKDRITILEDDDEFTRIEKQAALRAKRIRENGSKNESKKGSKIEDMFVAVIYEFPQYTLKDLFELNIYTLHYLFKYVGKIANYEVSKIAAGNGLTKKHKYFIEK
jgi:hypothetical protein